MPVVFAAAFWSYLVVTSAVLWLAAVVIWVVTLPFDRRRRLLHRFTCWWGYHYFQVCPLWRARIEGRENILPGRRYVIVANHQSMGDILMLFGLKRHFKFVSKAILFNVPFIGWNMGMNDYVRLVRGNRASVAKMFRACRKHLKRGSSILMFPEGTRSVDGEIKSFKLGSFTLAVETDTPVMPVVVDGTSEALPKTGWIFELFSPPLSVTVRVLEPIAPSEVDGDAALLSKMVRERMIDELTAIRGQRTARSTPKTPNPALDGRI